MRLLLAVLAVVALLSRSAWGDETDEAERLSEARAKFQQAIELEQAQNWPHALRLFREVGQVRMTPQVRFHIGVCEENLGRLAVALGSYELALPGAESVGSEFGNEVAQRIENLRARVPKLVLERGKGADAAVIELDGVIVGASSIGIELPVDPGPHTIHARAHGHEPFQKTVQLAERDALVVRIELVPIVPTASATPPPVRPQVSAEARRSRMLPYALGGVGVVSLAASGVFFVMQNDKVSELEEKCGPNRNQCPPSSRATYDDAKTFNTLSRITLGIGLAAIGVAATLVLTEGRTKPANARWQLQVGGTHRTASAALTGLF